VVVHYSSWPGVTVTIDAVLAQSLPPDRVVVVDNASPDGSGDMIAEHYRANPHVEVLVAPTNEGYAAACNLGVRQFQAEQMDGVVVLTHDTIPTITCLETLCEELFGRPEVGAIGPLLELSTRPGYVWSAGGALDGRLMRPRLIGLAEPVEDWWGREALAVDWLDGALVLYRMTALRDTGPMEESFFLYDDDVDFASRLRARSWVVVCAPLALAAQRTGTQSQYLAQRNYLLFVERQGSRALAVAAFADEVRRLAGACALHAARPSSGRKSTVYLRERAAGLRDYALRRFGRPEWIDGPWRRKG
jgi:GT2 family glycosyltransferase